MSISIRVPSEIRSYKEKIAFGLTARQIVCVIAMLIICVPLYWFGKDYIPSDILTWIIIVVALPLVSIGFLKYNNMPMEKAAVALFKSEFLYPRKRVFRTHNYFREWQNKAYAEEKPKSSREARKRKRQNAEIALERDYLTIKAEQSGDLTYTSDPNAEKAASLEIDPRDFLTVRTETGGRKNGKKPDKKKPTEKKNRLQESAEQIQAKLSKNPDYTPTAAEFALLKRYNDQQLKERKKQVQAGKKKVADKSKFMLKRRTAKSSVPRSTQDSIPYIADYEEGLFEVAPNKFSKMYRLRDINYTMVKEEEQISIFCKLGEFFNYFSEEMRFSICIDNRIVSRQEQERKIFKRMAGDKYDPHRVEYNRIMRRQIISGNNDMQTSKFITVTIDADTPIDALLRFHKIDAEVIQNIRRIGSDATVLSTDERLGYYHDKFRRGMEGDFHINYDFIKRQGISSKDYIAPSFMMFNRKDIQIEDEYYRVLFLNNLPAALSDEFLQKLCDTDFPITVSLCIEPVAQDRGLKIVMKQMTGIEANKIDAEKRAIRAGYSPETIQHSIKDAHRQAQELYDDMLNKNQRMFFVTFLVMVMGKTPEELDENCSVVMSKARQYTSQLQVLTAQQEEGFKMVLPFGYCSKELCVERALTTESTAIFMPFSNQELLQTGGFYYGVNQGSGNLVVVNRTNMKTPSGFVLGSSGSGKSFATKREILNVLLDDPNTGVLIIDPENEYGDYCRAFGGTVFRISADTTNYINPMDLPREYGLDDDEDEASVGLESLKDKAIKKKSDYIVSIVERMLNTSTDSTNSSAITPQQKTLIDLAVRETYKDYLDNDFDPAFQPTLLDFQDVLDEHRRDSEDARLVAEGVQYYTRGSMDIFSHKTNINVDNRLVVFNVRDLGDQLRQIALVIIFDFIWNRMIENKNKGVRTYCYCDEIHIMFNSYYSADFLKQLYKRGRKYGLCITGVTQNVEDLLRSEQARGMIGNSDFILMLNQNHSDLEVLAQMLNISPAQMDYVTGADAGSGLLFAEKVIVPFVDRFPTDSYLYKLMSTKFGEDMSKDDISTIIKNIMDQGDTESPTSDAEIEGRLQEIYSDRTEAG